MKLVCDVNVVIELLNKIIEINILFLGLGFESGGLVVVYVIYNGMIVLFGVYSYLYGEKVVFVMIV